ncbi:MAG: hypothetical protein IIV68_02760, partial [Alistipes sp.]|nr:hypothetical protein [Alistipes sp.]
LWEAYSSYPGILVKGATAVFFLVCGGGLLTALLNKSIGLWEKLLCLLLVALMPLGMNLIYVLTISRSHDLMTFPIWLFYLFVLLNADFLAQKWHRPGRWFEQGIDYRLWLNTIYPTAVEQVAVAGYRLAALLNSIF